MNIEKMTKIGEWISKSIDRIELEDQLIIIAELAKITKVVEPIYDKYHQNTAPKLDKTTQLLNLLLHKEEKEDEE